MVRENEEEKEKFTHDEEVFFNLFFYICYIIMDLIDAAKRNNIGRVRELLDQGADPNIRGSYNNYTALIYASSRGHTEIVELLLDNDADPNIQNNGNKTALYFASWLGNSDIVKLLLDNGADPNIRDEYGDTALMIAEYKDDVEKSKYFNFSKDFSKNYDVVARLIRDHINLQRARQRLAFATYLLGDDDLDYDVTSRIAEYVNDLDQYGSGRRRSSSSKRSSSRRRRRKNYTRRRFFQ